MKPRTLLQNNSLHKYLTMLAEELQEAGLDMKQILKPHIEIPPTPELLKDHLWRPIQISMFGKQSTTELTTIEVNKIYEVLNRHLGEKFGVHVPWPAKD